jgi:RimJ/RimL family protein N-acetyltransferase
VAVIRRYVPGDEVDFAALFGDPEVMRHVGGVAPDPAGLFRSLLDGSHPRVLEAYAVIDEAGAFLGHAALFRAAGGAVEIGVMIARPHWRRGHGVAAGRALLARARQLGFTAVEATVDLDNTASRRLLERLGLTLARTETDEDGEFTVYVLSL